MATATITPDKDAVQAEIFVAAPPERVFQAISDPAQTSQWWGQKGMYRVTEAKGDLKVGGKWSTSGVGVDGTTFTVQGEYLEIDPPKRLVHTWIPSYRNNLNTTVRWELEARDVHGLQAHGPGRVGTGTLVKLFHSGFGSDEKAARDHGNGWVRVLGWMQAFVEHGQTIESRP